MTIEIFKDAAKEWRFRIIAKNNKVVAQSEGYKKRAGARKTVDALVEGFKEGVTIVEYGDTYQGKKND